MVPAVVSGCKIARISAAGVDEVFELDNELGKAFVGVFDEDDSFETTSLHAQEVESLHEHIDTVLLGSCWWN